MWNGQRVIFCIWVFHVGYICLHACLDANTYFCVTSGIFKPDPSGGLKQTLMELPHKRSIWAGVNTTTKCSNAAQNNQSDYCATWPLIKSLLNKMIELFVKVEYCKIREEIWVFTERRFLVYLVTCSLSWVSFLSSCKSELATFYHKNIRPSSIQLDHGF